MFRCIVFGPMHAGSVCNDRYFVATTNMTSYSISFRILFRNGTANASVQCLMFKIQNRVWSLMAAINSPLHRWVWKGKQLLIRAYDEPCLNALTMKRASSIHHRRHSYHHIGILTPSIMNFSKIVYNLLKPTLQNLQIAFSIIACILRDSIPRQHLRLHFHKGAYCGPFPFQIHLQILCYLKAPPYSAISCPMRMRLDDVAWIAGDLADSIDETFIVSSEW
jgi:hypothetical protein